MQNNLRKYKSFKDVTNFHGHVCPGSALGYRAAQAAMEELSHQRAPDEEIVAIVENDTCAVDAVQVVSGCTMGKGNLIFQDYGKQVYTFFNRENSRGVRFSLKSSFDMNELEPKLGPLRDKISHGTASTQEKEQLKTITGGISQKIVEMPLEELFQIEKVELKLPPKARIFKSQKCSICGEMVSEHRSRIKSGKIVCIPCFEGD
ncbi:MAG: FmdE family protein [Methanobacteriaceae archaeon]|nr:FmdE family protein [Methanobacteriaceae archaeon]